MISSDWSISMVKKSCHSFRLLIDMRLTRTGNIEILDFEHSYVRRDTGVDENIKPKWITL